MSIEQVQEAIENACKRIAPAWPLENSVAVNPYLGVADMPFQEASRMLKYRGQINMHMPLDFYLNLVNEARIGKTDIEKSLTKNESAMRPEDFLYRAKQLKENHAKDQYFHTAVQLIDTQEQTDITAIMTHHCSQWLSNYFHENKTPDADVLYQQWKKENTIDLLPELKGLKAFRDTITGIPTHQNACILQGLEKMGITEDLVESYLHAILLQLIGWSSYCAGLDWQNQVYSKSSHHLKSLLAILISWEHAAINSYPTVKSAWTKQLEDISLQQAEPTNELYQEAQFIFQDAFDFAAQRNMATKFHKHAKAIQLPQKSRPSAQMVFCIDVRSEVYRRHLETVDTAIETIGFAGFFGFPVKYLPINHEKGRNQCPVLIPSGPVVYETTKDESQFKQQQQSIAQKGKLQTAWSKFKQGPISSYSFVSPLGIFFLPKLISDSFGWTSPVANPKKEEFGQIIAGTRKLSITDISWEDKLTMGKAALTAMGLTKTFAPLILITGHGASSVNNPHASGLDCGACGGSSGEINALTAQLILNDFDIREALRNEGIHIPDDSYFIACLHDTTTDEIHFLDESQIPTSHQAQLAQIKTSLSLASDASRQARAPRLGIKGDRIKQSFLKRSNDWAQVRPEWGLAGCSSFIIAPRRRTKGMDLEGKAFLHSYDWKSDSAFQILEAIMTAPMIVTSWINLQYYASTVDNKRMGAGNKTLHNVTAGIGVLEGASGDLRIGLPLQSIHDGKNYQHLPLRLQVIIEAPKDVVNEIIQRHQDIRNLCDNDWISIMTINDMGIINYRYKGHEIWENLLPTTETDKVEQLVKTV